LVLVIGAAIVHEGRVLAARRTSPAAVAGGWEFPGGKVEEGEHPEQAIVREVSEELGCRIEVTGHLTGEVPIREGYTLRVAIATLADGEPVPRESEHDAVRWLGPEELEAVDWLGPDLPFLDELREILLDGAPLDGGNVGGAVRVGHTVRRVRGAWTPAVHALLDHLEQQAVPGVPRVLGTDGRGREILNYLPGRIVDVDTELLTDAQLGSLAAWARRFHDAVSGFEHPGPWRLPASPGAELVAHNDLAPYNVCFAGDRVAGVFDWDLAAPSTRLMELAHLAWTSVPLFRDIGAAEAARRLGILAAAYGTCSAREVLDVVPRRVRASVDAIREAQERRDEGFLRLATVGEPERTQQRLAHHLERAPLIEKELS
jgi:mutator protein MutT